MAVLGVVASPHEASRSVESEDVVFVRGPAVAVSPRRDHGERDTAVRSRRDEERSLRKATELDGGELPSRAIEAHRAKPAFVTAVVALGQMARDDPERSVARELAGHDAVAIVLADVDRELHVARWRQR